MKWLNNLSVRLKVLSVGSLGILFFLAYLVYSYTIADASVERLDKMRQTDFAVLEATTRNNVTLYNVRDELSRAINNSDPDALDNARELATQATENLRSLKELDPGISSDVDELISAFRQYFDAASSLAENAIDGASGSDFYQELGEVAKLRDEFESILSDFRDQRHASFDQRLEQSRDSIINTQFIGGGLGLAALLLLGLISLRVTRSITRPIQYAVAVSDDIARGDWERNIQVDSRDETGRLLDAIRQMRDALKARRDEEQREELIKSRLAELNERMRGDMTLQQLGTNMLEFLVPTLDGQVGAFFLYDEEDEELQLNSSWALARRKHLANSFRPGESLVGQCALERKQILLTEVPDDYIEVSSATGATVPKNVVVTPIVHEDELKGVVEFGSVHGFSDDDLAFLDQGVKTIAIALHTAQSRVRLSEMLEKTQEQAREMERQKEELHRANEDLEQQAKELSDSEARLQQQQEELRSTNEELEQQTQALRASEENLQAQQEELRVTNEELESQKQVLQEQKAEVDKKNEELERLHSELQEKIEELELSSKYKSQFLSTMSHELRTPLNSILILSNALADNKKGNLTDKQMEHAQVIHSAGSDLLALINDILDISKIEEGKMNVVIDELQPQELGEHFRKHFAHIAEDRGLDFHIELGEDLPEYIYTDRQRLEQVVKNLLSNALKFTEEGSVTVEITRPEAVELPHTNLKPEETIRFAVRDTGIGIPLEKQKLIFEAFQQADGTTSRKFGGTGLGLTISRELSRLLGGDVGMYSEGEGKGTTFKLFLPVGDKSMMEGEGEQDSEGTAGSSEPPVVRERSPEDATAEPDTRAQPEDTNENYEVREKTVLIIEDDDDFGQVLVDLAADYGLEGHISPDGETGLEYARHYRPSAIILDIGLPGMDGWEVMEKLKADARTQDIPVHFLSGKDEREKAMQWGAIDFLTKPLSRDQMLEAFKNIESAVETNVRHLLVVEDSELQHESIRELFDEKGVEITAAKSGEEAMEKLRKQVYDCMILDLSLPDMSGMELLETIHESEEYDSLPVIVYTGKELSRDEEGKLHKYADRIILKTERSSERLLNEASLFLHWLESRIPEEEKPSKTTLEHRSEVFEGKKLMLVDDDMRNIYALSAQLEELGFEITLATNGREALEALEENPDMDLVLMDIMMPEMDGYEAMQKIREQEQFQKLPIIALTAKAMKEDRAKCIEAGANDYCSKPIDMTKLTSLMRVWLQK